MATPERGRSGLALFDAPPTIERSATVSDCGLYRYTLGRVWHAERPAVLFVMLNPSTADADQDDPTIRRCIRFARDWGYGGLHVGNLYALRATNPADLQDAREAGVDPVGPDNDRWLSYLRGQSDMTVAAWGTHPMIAGRAADVMDLIGGLHVLGLTAKGNPRHPLYLRADTFPSRWTHA